MTIIGLMSGTSLDGIDIALCEMEGASYRIIDAVTVPYSDLWHRRLASLEEASAWEFVEAHIELGHLFGQEINRFLRGNNHHVDAVASHGHTIFHQPDVGVTAQIGDGDAIAAETGLPVVSNFRTLDVALGGQGAPLVPIGDELLFGNYDACLNLGGIANISYRAGGKRVAYDICPCNMALNRLASRLGLPYDPEGSHARRGRCHGPLLEALGGIGYYAAPPPKSLGKEWLVSEYWPLVEAAPVPVEDLLCTVVSHTADQIARVLNRQRVATLLVSGGGAFNRFLLEKIGEYAPGVEITVPDALIVNYKEALVFAMLGYLRLTGRVNTLASVTGARCDSVGGTVSGMFR